MCTQKKNNEQIVLFGKKIWTKIVEISYYHIVYLSAAKNQEGFSSVSFQDITSNVNLYTQNHFCTFSVACLTDCTQSNTKSCKIGSHT